MKLTQRLLSSLSPPAGKADHIEWDDALPGFGLRLRGEGRTFVVQYKLGTQHRRMKLGTTAKLSLEEARHKARTYLGRVHEGRDPQAEKKAAVAQLADRCEAHMRDYLLRQKAKLRPSSYARSEQYLLDLWKPLHAMPLAKIDRRTIATRLNQLVASNGPATTDRARAVLSAFFTWAVKGGLTGENPVAATERPYENKERQRALNDAELTLVWRALGEDAYGTIIKLLILTGQRRDEIGGLRWSEIDFTARVIRLPGERVKNGHAHNVPLSEPAAALLQSVPVIAGRDFVFGSGAHGFGGYSIPKAALDARIAAAGAVVTPWCVHDLRRSAATGMAEIDVDPHIIEAVINHVSGHKAGVAGVYNKARYERKKRQALDLWAEHVMALVEGRTSNVVALRA
jgi:integrase